MLDVKSTITDLLLFPLILALSACVAPCGAYVSTAGPEEPASRNGAEQRIASALGSIDGFLWGTATAAYQVEGAWNVNGRQKSIWDVYSQTPGNTYNNENGDVADDFYHLYESDIQRIKNYGFNSFRFSLSWTRIMPSVGGVRSPNRLGVEFYKNVTKTLLDNGITPIATIFHWDLPDDLDWLSDAVVPAFVEYAHFVLKTFPEIKNWATFNEPWTFCSSGYGSGDMAPGKKSEYDKFICGHNVLLAHSQIVAIYKEELMLNHQGTIGIVLNYDWAWPLNSSDPLGEKAIQCSIDFRMGWFADPVYFGDYPACMRERLGDFLPKFTPVQKANLKGSVVGPYLMNTYHGVYTRWDDTSMEGHSIGLRDMHGNLIGPQADSPWLHVVPAAVREQLIYVTRVYKPDGIIITENGVDVPGENAMSLQQALDDQFRISYFRGYLDEIATAVRDYNVPLKGYIAWSLMDNFEWSAGYKFRFGITYVNYTTLDRYPKASAGWFSSLIKLSANPPEIGATRPPTRWVYGFLAAIAAPFCVVLGCYLVVADNEQSAEVRKMKRGVVLREDIRPAE